jgi:hypothetical protein
MTRSDLLHTLSGCQFYRTYLDVHTRPKPRPAKSRAPKTHPRTARPLPTAAERQVGNRVFQKFGLALAILSLGSLVLLVLPLWVAFPPYGRSCLLSLPPMALCALSWMGGAWWARDRGPHLLMAATMGGMPLRICLVLAWTWLVVPLEGISIIAFVLGMMAHWVLFTVPELVMLVELGQHDGATRRVPTKRTARKGSVAGDHRTPVRVRVLIPGRSPSLRPLRGLPRLHLR